MEPKNIEVRGARVHNLKNIDVDIPLGQIVGIAGVSGSGKSSLALGVLYAEGSRRYLESLSTYTRRRMTQAAKADVDDLRYIPSAIALHQRPGVPGMRSTFGTSTELLNNLRILFSRLSEYPCPKCGTYHKPTIDIAAESGPLVCANCGTTFHALGAEQLAFNSEGACERCGGTGVALAVDRSTLVPDESLTIDEGAVAPWKTLMWALMTDVVRELGVRTDVPFNQLTPKEREIVFNGPAEKVPILYRAKKTDTAAKLDFTYYNTVHTVENALAKVTDEKGMKRVEKFLKSEVCPCCHGTRLSEKARGPRIMGINLAEVTAMSLTDLIEWIQKVPAWLPDEMRPMARSIIDSFMLTARRLMELGLGYLTLDRAASTLSTGERQRMQLARVVRNRTTGVLYVLDEPSIGLHPANIEGLTGVMHDLIHDGNSVVLVDHDTQILKESNRVIELGPEAGANGGRIIAEGTVAQIEQNPASMIGPFLAGREDKRIRPAVAASEMFDKGVIEMSMTALHTVKPLTLRIPKGRLTVVTGMSGSGKTTVILESLVPGLTAIIKGEKLPEHVTSVSAKGIENVKLIDSTPIGANVRSTVATYANVHDDLRKLFAKQPSVKELGYKAGDFSYNTGSLRCPECDGTGEISLDVQFLPDVDIPCPLCNGSRYAAEAWDVKCTNKHGDTFSLPQLMGQDVNTAIGSCEDWKTLKQRLETLRGLGLGYLTLGEATPSLSGGEAQRLKLALEMGREQGNTLFVFDEPTIGLHPLDVRTLLGVFQQLIELGATVVVIEHDLDVMRNADYIIDMGPQGGIAGGEIVAEGTAAEVAANPASITGRYIVPLD
ncbi:MAG: ATP-binding cassette domain-containing protein [Muribaculaceae bacterium]|nr:ATP-binding cassette domain-containing protein [Muribaculaceae bacterium]